MHTQYYKEYSHCLQRDMEFKVYGHAGLPFIVFPCQDGKYFDFESRGMIETVRNYIEEGRLQQYEGGYTEYLEAKQRREEAAGAAAPKMTTAAASTKAPVDSKNDWKENRKQNQPVKLKFTYKEQREFETIDDDIAALEDKLADIEAQMEEYASSYTKLTELTAEKEAVEAQLEEKMERWVYLNELKEKIDAQGK